MTFESILVQIDKLFEIYQVWITIGGLIFTFFKLYQWAHNKKTGALVIGILVQMVLPDPEVEQKIEVVQKKEQTQKKAQENGDDL